MHLHHLHFGSGRIKKLLQSDFALFEISVWLHTVARSFVSVFIPVLLLRAGFDIQGVLLYLLMFFILNVGFNWLARISVWKWGARAAIFLSTFASIVFFFVLSAVSVDQGWLILLVLAALNAIYDALYFVAHLYLFMNIEAKEGNMKKGTGMLYAVRMLATLLGPAIGAVLLIYISDNLLVYVSVFFLMLSMIPLYRASRLDDKPALLSRMTLRMFTKEEWGIFLTHMLWSVHRIVEMVMWPLYIYITVGTIQSVAIVSTLTIVASIIFSYASGYIPDKYRSRLMLVGVTIVGLVWLLRLGTEASWFYYVSAVLVGFATLFVSIPLDNKIFSLGAAENDRYDALMISAMRNVASMTAGIILFGVLIFAQSLFVTSFIAAVISAGLVMMLVAILFGNNLKN